MRSIHTAVLTSAIAAPPEAVALSAQSWLMYQLAPMKGLSIRLPQSAELVEEATLEDGALDEGALEDGTLEEGTLDEGTLEDGTLEDGALEDGALDDGTLLTTTLELLELTGVLLAEEPPTMP